ncbi:MAG: GRAM domain-containing protein [Actinomycetota bacterium]|nr:GRAM domain-containing protein [Actinomycetota bacterium]MDQ3956678.1 GRAM domain-containing protein [Actinomycetota bacterium]
MPAAMRSAAIAGLVFGLAMGLVLGAMSRSIAVAIMAGLVGGVLFGIAIAGFSGRQTKKFEAQDPTVVPGEVVLKRGPANHFRSGEAVGGYLYLTNTQLLFQSHSFNIQNHRQSVPLDSITGVRPRMTWFLIPNGLRVTSSAGVDKFVVDDRDGWVQAISAARGTHEQG